MLGRNGAGKTTLLRSITGVNPPAVGSILLDGTEIAKLKSHRRTWLGISYVPQGREIIPDITVAENIYVALLGKGRKAKDVPKFIFDYFPALKKPCRPKRRHAFGRSAATARNRPRTRSGTQTTAHG